MKKIIKTLSKILPEKKPFQSEARYLRHEDKKYRWHLLRAVPIFNQNNNIDYWIGTAIDIHEQKMLEIKKDEFLNIASHELKTPLSTQKVAYQLILQNFPQNEEGCLDILKKLGASINRMEILIDELLDVSRIDTNNMMYDFDWHRIEEILETVLMEYSNVGFNINLHGEINVPIECDQEKLFRIFDNLVSNAIKYSKDSNNIDVFLQKTDSKAIIKVRDYGIGISRDDLNLVFDRYYRVKSKRNIKGLGLGLYITKKIVVAHQGEIKVNSEIGKGSEFEVVLPLNQTQKQ